MSTKLIIRITLHWCHPHFGGHQTQSWDYPLPAWAMAETSYKARMAEAGQSGYTHVKINIVTVEDGPNTAPDSAETPLTNAVWRSVESKDWKESFAAMHDHAEKLETKLKEAERVIGGVRHENERLRGVERALRSALVYVDRQVREVWKAEDTYQKTHREWATEQAAKALRLE